MEFTRQKLVFVIIRQTRWKARGVTRRLSRHNRRRYVRHRCKLFNSAWRSKALRGPGSTVTWRPSLSLLSTSPLPFPPLFLLFPSPAPPLPRSGPQIQLGVWGSAVSSPAGSGVEPQPKWNLVHFSLKIRHLVATVLMIVLRDLPKIFLWPHYSGPPGARGPGSLNRLEPRVPTPLLFKVAALRSCTLPRCIRRLARAYPGLKWGFPGVINDSNGSSGTRTQVWSVKND